MNLGDKVFELRDERGWSQKRLAEIAGVSQTTVVNIETGKIPVPRTPTLRRLARALGVEVEALIGRPIGPKVPALLPDELLRAPGAARHLALKAATEEQRAALIREIDAKDEELKRQWVDSADPADRAELWDFGHQLRSLRNEVEGAGIPIRMREVVE